MLLHGFDDVGLGGGGGVLGGDHHVVDAHGLAVHVFEGDLGLAVRTEEGHGAVLAHLGQLLGELVGPEDGGGHEGGGLVAGKAEHHALVTGALVFGSGAQHALGDVGGLVVDGGDHGAGVGVEAHVGAGVADLADGLAHHVGQVGVARGGDLAGDDRHAGGHQGLAGHVGVGVLGQQGVQDGVGDLVRHLVGMAFGHGLGGEEIFALGLHWSVLHGSVWPAAVAGPPPVRAAGQAWGSRAGTSAPVRPLPKKDDGLSASP